MGYLKNMKKGNLFVGAMLIMAMAAAGCSSQKNVPESEEVVEELPEATENWNKEIEEVKEEVKEVVQEAEAGEEADKVAEDNTNVDAASTGDVVSICDEDTQFDYDKDYYAEIVAAVDNAVRQAGSLEEEFAAMDDIHEVITKRRDPDQTQYEMNVASKWYYQVWQAELANLLVRTCDAVDEDTKTRLETEQKNWDAMLGYAATQFNGPSEEGGSIYPILYNGYMEDATKRRCYYLASILAEASGSSYSYPEKEFLGSYIDDEGTGEVYSILAVRSGWESDCEAAITLYRLGDLKGPVTEEADGTLKFTSEDGLVTGIITCSNAGATFEVTEADATSIVAAGDKFEFPIVY